MPEPDMKKHLAAETVHSQLALTILEAVGHVPATEEGRSGSPLERARHIVSSSAMKAGLAAGTMAMPPGLAGMLTLVPELLAVWRLQTQMVADIAAAYGQTSKLTREQMLYCLFKATAATAVGSLVVMVGESVLIQRPALRGLQRIAEAVGMKVTRRLMARGVARWLPIAGAVGVGAYAYYETKQVGHTAIELFEKPIEIEGRVVRPRRAKRAAGRKPSKKAPPAKKLAGKTAAEPAKKRVRKRPVRNKG